MTERKTQAPRRRKGEGSVARWHREDRGCPPVLDGVRPDHRCTAPYRARVWVTTATGQRVRKEVFGTTEKEVLKAVKDLTVKEGTGRLVAASPTVEDWLRTDGQGGPNWWTEATQEHGRKPLKITTRKTYVSYINQYLIPGLGKHRLDKLKVDQVERLYDDMRAKGLSESTVRQAHNILHRALRVAQRKGKVAVNVTDLLEPPSVVQGSRQGLTVAQAWAVLRTAGENPRHWVSLLAGIRQGEALGLQWGDVELDEESPFLVVRRTLVRAPGRGLVFDTPKSRTSTDRVIPLVPPVAARLRAARAKAFAEGATVDDQVFTNRLGTALDPRKDYQGWVDLLKAAGVPHTALHAARNTTAHLLEDAGVPARVVSEILGHSSVQMTYRYQQGNVPARVEAMKALDAHMALHDTELEANEEDQEDVA